MAGARARRVIYVVKGGLNIGSLKAFNLALLQKWRWRLLSSPNALWVQVIKAYHGQEGGFDTNGCSFKGIWANIVGTSNFLHSKDTLYLESLVVMDLLPLRMLVIGLTKISFPLLLILLLGINLSPGLKVNVFCGGFLTDSLLRLNLSSRGMDIPAISCPSCNANVESANHVFFECDIATDMWKLVFRWCDIPFFQASSWDSFNDWIISWHASKEKKHRFYVITTSSRSSVALEIPKIGVTFNSQPLRKSDLFDNVRFSSFRASQ
ncbi:RNA-directed DNA polymerase, eukaryota, reverse transcriptase zinc-binding domain protein [Tanacetum coccineum]